MFDLVIMSCLLNTAKKIIEERLCKFANRKANNSTQAPLLSASVTSVSIFKVEPHPVVNECGLSMPRETRSSKKQALEMITRMACM